jgi:hypothetical protein
VIHTTGTCTLFKQLLRWWVGTVQWVMHKMHNCHKCTVHFQTTIHLKRIICWDMMPCSLVKSTNIWRNVLPPSSRSMSIPSNKQTVILPVTCLAYFSTVKQCAAPDTYRTKGHYILEESTLQSLLSQSQIQHCTSVLVIIWLWGLFVLHLRPSSDSTKRVFLTETWDKEIQ